MTKTSGFRLFANRRGSLDLGQALPLVLVAAGAVLLYVGLSSSDVKVARPAAQSEEMQRKVNRHLEATAEKIEMQRKQMEIQNQRLVLEYGTKAPTKAYTPPKEGSDLVSDDRGTEVARDLGRSQDNIPALPENPVDLIHHQLFQRQREAAQNEVERKEYARQFIENARRGGWDIKLDANYKVISVNPVRQPSDNGFKVLGE